MTDLITIDGAHGEGGGQILRTALAMSLITQKPFKITDIRKTRKDKGGLKNQHVHAIKIIQDLTNSKVIGAELGSTELVFMPKPFKKKTAEVDIGTAGSVTLLLQALLPACIHDGNKFKLTITGGTDVAWSMPIDYCNDILLPALRPYATSELKLIKRGYYPKGDGTIELTIQGNTHKQQRTLREQGTLIQIKGVSHASANLQEQEVAERMAQAATTKLKHSYAVPVTIRTEYQTTASPGAGIFVYAVYSLDEDDLDLQHPIRIGQDALGKPKESAETVGEQAAQKLITEMQQKAPVDHHLADNLIPFIALYGGSFKTTHITHHLRSNAYVVNEFLGEKVHVHESTNIIQQT